MPKTYRLAVAGLVHDHVWNELEKWRETGRVELVAAADPNPPLTKRAADEFGAGKTFDDYERMLDDVRPDVVQICTSNAAGADVVVAAAERGVHVVIEKPLAARLEQAERMLAAVEKAGVRMFVNWPFRWRPATTAAWKQVADGAVGRVFNARVRMAHKGPREFGCSDYFCDWLYDASQNGAGALVDYCCYGAAAFSHQFGLPEAVQAVAARLTKTDVSVDDNAAITLIYKDRFAVTEASWSQIPSYHDAVYLGTEGTLWTLEGKMFLATESEGEREIPVEPLPEGKRSGPECFLSCLESESPFPDVCDAGVCRDAQEILEAGIVSNETGRRVMLPLS